MIPAKLTLAIRDLLTEHFEESEISSFYTGLCARVTMEDGGLEGSDPETRAMNLVNEFTGTDDHFAALVKGLIEYCPRQFGASLALMDAVYQYGLALADARDWKRAQATFGTLSGVMAVNRRICAALGERSDTPADRATWTARWDTLQGFKTIVPDLACLEPLSQKHLDAVYAWAVTALDAQRWDEAIEALQTLEQWRPGFRDVAQRLTDLQQWERWYAEGRAHWSASQWDAAAEPLGRLVAANPHYKDAASSLAAIHTCQQLKAEGRTHLADPARLETDEEWDQVAQLFQRIETLIPGYGEAAIDLRLVQGLRAMRRKAWAAAAAALSGVATRRPDDTSVQQLQGVLRNLDHLRRHLAAGYVRDPWLQWAGRHPYEELEAAGLPHVTPAASMKVVDDASFELLARRMTPEQRTAWDALRDTGRRLFVDAFLIPCHDLGRGVAPLVAHVEDMAARLFRSPDPDALIESFPQQAPIVLLLLGERQRAEALLEAQQRQSPRDIRLAHQLALLHLATAERLDPAEHADAWARAWSRAIGQWALLLTEADYWQEWVRARTDVYGRPVQPVQVRALPSLLQEELSRRLSHAEQLAGGADRPARSLRLDLQAELTAVRLMRLQEVGGAPTEDRGSVICGPSLLEALDVVDILARLIGRLTEQPSTVAAMLLGAPSEGTVRRLRWYFSSLKRPAVLIEGMPAEPEQALNLLRSPGRIEDEPIYAALLRSEEVAQEDVLRLMAEARLLMAEDRITREGAWDLRLTKIDWQTALDLARRWEDEDTVKEQIRRTALARCHDLDQERDEQNGLERLNRAVDLIELTQAVTGSNQEMLVRLGNLLSSRGLMKANVRKHQDAVSDFERSFQLLPYVPRVRFRYAFGLALLAESQPNHEHTQALEQLNLAEKLIDEGRQTDPDYADYATAIPRIASIRARIEGLPVQRDERELLEELDRLFQIIGGEAPDEEDSVTALVGKAARQRQASAFADALETLETAWTRAPDDPNVRDELPTVIAARAAQLRADGAMAEYEQLVETWRARLAGSSVAASHLMDALKWFPTIERYLDQHELIHQPGPRQSLMLPFAAGSQGSVTVRLWVERDAVVLVAPLAAEPPGERAIVLSSLLDCTAETPHTRVADLEFIGLVLMCYTPVRYLDADYLEYLTRATARYADMPPAILRQIGQLRGHFGARRAMTRLFSDLSWGPWDERLKEIEPFCRTAGWPHTEDGDDHASITAPFGTVEVTSDYEGIRLALDLGALRSGADRPSSLTRLVSLNARPVLGKLVLAPTDRVHLVCELPYLDGAGLQDVMSHYADSADQLRAELTQR